MINFYYKPNDAKSSALKMFLDLKKIKYNLIELNENNIPDVYSETQTPFLTENNIVIYEGFDPKTVTEILY